MGDLLRMYGLDNLAVFTCARRVVARQVARGGERRVVGTVLRAELRSVKSSISFF
ncbi:MAG: hypothetical protein WKF71_20810 [Pyrinomonadaceae bacterium]